VIACVCVYVCLGVRVCVWVRGRERLISLMSGVCEQGCAPRRIFEYPTHKSTNTYQHTHPHRAPTQHTSMSLPRRTDGYI